MPVSSIKTIEEKKGKSRNLWVDSLQRLLRNKAALIGIVFIIIIVIMTIFADQLATAPYDKQNLPDQNVIPAWVAKLLPSMAGYAPISDKYLLGADKLGRDIFSRILYGGRVSLAVAIFAPLLSLLIGTTFGALSGFAGGNVDTVMMRIVDILYAFPSLLFIILLMTYFKGTSSAESGTFAYYVSRLDARLNGILFIFVGIAITSWHTMARLTRGQVLSVRKSEYIEAARLVGAGNRRIISRHIMPNIIGPLIVAITMEIPLFIAIEAFLSFIGIGVNPPMPSWGSMISDGAEVLRSYPSQVLFPAFVLAATMFAFNFLGDGLRDALDPRLRGTQ
jgi:oligopeptide transport system permease protein